MVLQDATVIIHGKAQNIRFKNLALTSPETGLKTQLLGNTAGCR